MLSGLQEPLTAPRGAEQHLCKALGRKQGQKKSRAFSMLCPHYAPQSRPGARAAGAGLAGRLLRGRFRILLSRVKHVGDALGTRGYFPEGRGGMLHLLVPLGTWSGRTC